MKKEKLIECAVITALNVFNVRSHHGAVIFNDDKIISRGYNRKIVGIEKHTIHAEMDALCNVTGNVRERLKDAYVLVIRLNKRGKLTNSMPCEDCQRTLKAYGIKKVFYSISGGEIMEMKL